MDCLRAGAALSMLLSEDHDGATVGFDLAKNVSQAITAEGAVLVRRKLHRTEVMSFIAKESATSHPTLLERAAWLLSRMPVRPFWSRLGESTGSKLGKGLALRRGRSRLWIIVAPHEPTVSLGLRILIPSYAKATVSSALCERARCRKIQPQGSCGERGTIAGQVRSLRPDW